MFPMVYALLPNKQRQTYSRAFLLLKDAAMNSGQALDPTTFKSDFELAMIQAATLNFQSSSHHGCYYHYKQAIWRKVQSLGLAGEYNCPIDDTFKMFVNKMAAIAFCPPQFVRTAWLGVKQEDMDDRTVPSPSMELFGRKDNSDSTIKFNHTFQNKSLVVVVSSIGIEHTQGGDSYFPLAHVRSVHTKRNTCFENGSRQ